MPGAAPSSSVRIPALAVLLLVLPLISCTRTVEFVNLTTGSSLRGTHNFLNRSMSVMLPTGETATGTYTKLTMSELGPESLFFGANAGEWLGLQTTERVYGYARLQGEKGTAVEIIFASDWLGHGYGVARTSLNEEYRVTF